jgi:hypothetical protein
MSLLRFTMGATRLAAAWKHPKIALTVPTVLRARNEWNLHHQQYRGHKNLGHKPVPVPIATRAFHAFIAFMMVACILDYKK